VLPSELLVARKYGDNIRPVYAKLTRENLEVAERLIRSFKRLQGRRKRELEEAVDELEETGLDYRYVRGLSVLLERRCQFKVSAAVNPVEARKRVFHATARHGIPTTVEERQRILGEEAAQLEVSAGELERSLYADLDEELVLAEFQPVEPERLVRQYNLSLTQTLLFRCTEMEFTASGNWQQIFRWIKWLGLIYTIQRRKEGYWVKVDGPLSLFKLNHRYGTSLAKLIPYTTAAWEWSIKAKILRRRGDRQLLNLELDSRRHGAYLKAAEPTLEEKYDSLVEEEFAQRFNALRTGWMLTREPEPLPVGKHVMIPDFLFEKAGMKVYMEVAGFWTPEYLKHKLKQLSKVENVDMMVAADRSNACQRLNRMGRRLKIIYYKGKVPLKPIIDHLKSREDELGKRQLKQLRDRNLKFDEPVLTVAEIASQLGLLEEAVEDLLREQSIPEYRLLGDVLIRESKLNMIEKRLNQRAKEGSLTLNEVGRLIEESGGLRPTKVLEALGYRIEWHGINPEKAKVYRKTG
jgi:predicted nuclease of restriction endonuclease-like RecB superfamily